MSCAFTTLVSLIPLLASLSIVLSLIATTVIYFCLLDLEIAPALSAAALFAGFASAPVWRISTTVEPFALNLALAAFCVLIGQKLLMRQGNPRLLSVALGATFGLGLCNHQTLVLLAPFAAYTLLVESRGREKRLASFTGGFLLGALPLAYFYFARNSTAHVWGDWSSFWPRLLTHLLRSEYGVSLTVPPIMNRYSWGHVSF